MLLKLKLIEIDLVVENEYLDKYVELIEKNLNRPKEKFKTQNHHIIPKYYFKDNNLDVDNSKSNLVNLLYKDHILAHYYLALCSKCDKFICHNKNAILHIAGNRYLNIQLKNTLNDFINNLDNYQFIYEKSREVTSIKHKGKIISLETRMKESISHKGKKYKPMSEEGKRNISISHKGKKPPVFNNEKIAKKISETRINKKLKNIYKEINGIEVKKSVPQDILNEYLNDG